jgi:hypothetical protein
MNKEYIKAEASNKEAWICICGNTPVGIGFYPCNRWGNEIDPSIGSGWKNLYICFKCGRMIDQETLQVTGFNKLIRTLDGDIIDLWKFP